jgi:hypothetical protein
VSDERDERLAANENLFRTLNEGILDIAVRLGGDAPYEFICECSTSGCFERIPLTLVDYERVRESGTRFLVAAGHEDITVEQVIATKGEYVVVEKDGPASVIAEEENPRA